MVAFTQHKSGANGESLQQVAESVVLAVFLIFGEWKRKETGSETVFYQSCTTRYKRNKE
jgi:hypothetical protein